tara:strand:- start:340 stop:528 length:189 start_codon:yes stop_codon:yes gene_type:complete
MLSRIFLINQEKCCGLECLMCPYENKHSGLSSIIRQEVWNELEDWEKEQLKVFTNDVKKIID